MEDDKESNKNVLVEVDSSVRKLAEGAALLDLGSLLGVLSRKEKLSAL